MKNVFHNVLQVPLTHILMSCDEYLSLNGADELIHLIHLMELMNLMSLKKDSLNTRSAT